MSRASFNYNLLENSSNMTSNRDSLVRCPARQVRVYSVPAGYNWRVKLADGIGSIIFMSDYKMGNIRPTLDLCLNGLKLTFNLSLDVFDLPRGFP